MRLLEHEAKTLLQEIEVALPRGSVVTSSVAAATFSRELGCPVVLKAQIPVGGRMKAGGVLFAETPDKVYERAEELFHKTVRGFVVEKILVEERLAHQQELFVAVTYDSAAKSAILLSSVEGGINVEAATRPVVRRAFSARLGLPEYSAREVASELGFSGRELLDLGRLVHRLAQLFLQIDASLLEINPLLLTSQGKWVAADAHVEIEDEALYRQTALRTRFALDQRRSGSQTLFEQRAAEIDQADHRGVAGRVVEFDGDLGLLIGGGGASLTILDAILAAGGRPANYCEIGGNPSVWKVKELTKLILSQPRVTRVAVIMNIVSNTRADLVARGVIKGILELGEDPRARIAAFRIPGSWEDESQAILRHYGIRGYGREDTIDEVVAQVVPFDSSTILRHGERIPNEIRGTNRQDDHSGQRGTRDKHNQD